MQEFIAMRLKNNGFMFFLLFVTNSVVLAEGTPIYDHEKIENRLIKIEKIDAEKRLYSLEHKVKIVDSNQLNYKIEKNLIKDTYSNNFDKINTVITVIFGVFAIFGYLGFKGISEIKEEYKTELQNLIALKNKFETRSKEINDSNKSIDNSLQNILSENQEQNNKIKFLELKDKIRAHIKDDKFLFALEYADAALELYPDDKEVLGVKAYLLTRLNRNTEALTIYDRALKIYPDDKSILQNYTECLYFEGEIEKANNIIEAHENLFSDVEEKKILKLFEAIKCYHENRLEGLQEIAKTLVTTTNLNSKNKYFSFWKLEEAQVIIHYYEDSEIKKAVQNIVWYLNDAMTGQELLNRLGLPTPE